MKVQIKVDKSKFADYILVGKSCTNRIRTVMKAVANVGRTSARQRISSQFKRRTGALNREARGMRTSANASPGLVNAKVSSVPSLMNIFEKGATIPERTIKTKSGGAFRLHGGGWDGIFVRGPITIGSTVLAPRPVMKPALLDMEKRAQKDITEILDTAERGVL